MSIEDGLSSKKGHDFKSDGVPIDSKTQRKTQNDHVNGKRGGATKK